MDEPNAHNSLSMELVKVALEGVNRTSALGTMMSPQPLMSFFMSFLSIFFASLMHQLFHHILWSRTLALSQVEATLNVVQKGLSCVGVSNWSTFILDVCFRIDPLHPLKLAVVGL